MSSLWYKDAVIYELFGSTSTFVFGLPVLRLMPRRWPRFRRFFELPDDGPEPTAGTNPPQD